MRAILPRIACAAFIVVLLAAAAVNTASTKSLYVIKELNTSQISAYDIQPSPSYLALQSTSSSAGYGGVGLAIDSDSEILFITKEFSGTLSIVDAKTLTVLGTVSAPYASDLAGIVYDHDNSKVYCIQRSSNNLYIYSWNPTTKTLTNDITTYPYYLDLSGVSYAFGLALDEMNDILFVADYTTQIKKFNTSTWTSAGTVPCGHNAVSVAIDVANQYVYSGSWGVYTQGYLRKYDLGTSTETSIALGSVTGGSYYDQALGISVDPATTLVYITTGEQGSYYGSDRIIVFNSSLTPLHWTGDIGTPTGIVVPGRDVSYNPLNLAVTDNPADYVCPGQNITYTLSYDNLANAFAVTNTTLRAYLSPDVTYVSCTGGGVYDNVNHWIDWNIGTVAAGATSTSIDVVVQVGSSVAWDAILQFGATIDGDQIPPTTKNETTEVEDVTPPVINSITLSPSVLWPPNHRMVTITPTIVAMDNCAVYGVCPYVITLQSVTSNEPENGLGDGDTPNDILIIDATTAAVRAERAGMGTGRIYTFTYRVTDCRGNFVEDVAYVYVPHSSPKGIARSEGPLPDNVSLAQNYPNPFNPTTTIPFALPRDMNARLVVYDITGREVEVLVNGYLTAGSYEMQFDAGSLASGVYLYRLETSEGVLSRTLRLTK